jgi:hypothetical protein
MSKSFRLPRKVKKKLNKTLWLYPEETGGYLMAQPSRNEKDYLAYKSGIVKDIFTRGPKDEPAVSLDTPTQAPKEELKKMIEDVFSPEFQVSAYQKLVDASQKADTAVAYYNFINAYHLYQQGNLSYGNICCLSVDNASRLLKAKRKRV